MPYRIEHGAPSQPLFEFVRLTYTIGNSESAEGDYATSVIIKVRHLRISSIACFSFLLRGHSGPVEVVLVNIAVSANNLIFSFIWSVG